jgi:SSS family solute:Na+ symporter
VATLDLLVVAIYMAVIVAAGFIARRRATTQEQFLVAGRSVGPWLYSGTLAAIVLGGASTVGGVTLGYKYGISGMWLVFMLGLGILVLSVVFVGRLLGLRLYTVPELLERRYSRVARIAGGLVMTAYDLMVAVTATIAVGSVMQVIAGIPSTPAILLSSAVMVLYTVLGGMWSLTLTDIIQFVIKTIGMFFILLPVAVWHAGGLSAMHAHLPPSFFSLTGIGGSKILSYFILYVFGILIGQDVWQRVFTARSVRVARYGGIGVGCYCLLYALAGALIGAAGHAFLPPLGDADEAFARIVNAVLPVGLRGLLLAAALAAIMSTASACLLAASTVLLEDVYLPLRGTPGRGAVRDSRIVTLLLGAVMIVLSCYMHDVVAALSIAYDFLVGGLLVAVTGAILWPRGTSAAALASIATGSILVCVLLALRGINSDLPLYIGLGGSFLVYVLVSLGTARR